VLAKHAPSSASGLGSLPTGSIIGTSSVRRSAQIRATFPHLEIADIRGNLNTRMKKLDGEWTKQKQPDYSALVLATAGIIRLGWRDRISEVGVKGYKQMLKACFERAFQ